MSDAIILDRIEFLASHGATEEEQLRLQRFSVDMMLEMDLSSPAESDRLRDTADYSELGRMVIDIGTKSRHRLLESLAEEIADTVCTRWPRARVTISVRKIQPPVDFPVHSIAIRLTRGPRP